jgi:hypothetical protein
MTTVRITRSRHAIAMAAGLALAGLIAPGLAQAGEDDTPWSLTLSETVTRDSNFSRTEKPTPETVSSTAVRLSFDKIYGRQTYALDATWAANRYHNYKKVLNNDSKNLSGSFRTGLLRDLEFTLGGNVDENLNPIQNNVSGARVVRNLRKSHDLNTSLRYGIGGDWAVVGTLDRNHLDYSEKAYATLNADQTSQALRVNYYSTDLLYYGLGLRQVRTDYPDRKVFGTQEVQRDTNVDFTVNWQVTGMSNLDALVSRRQSTFASDDTRKLKGWNGSIDWRFTPRGLFTYGLNWSKLTSADRQVDTYVFAPGFKSDLATINNVTTYRAYANAQLTGKVTAGVNYSLSKSKYDYSNQGFFVTEATFARDSISHNAGFYLSYQPIRAVGLRCGTSMYSQTRDQTGIRFSGRSYDCSGSFTFQ